MDPRVIRTRKALKEALRDLIQERRWEKITVQDMLDRTGISRSTFYAHYGNKLEVLTDGIPMVTSTMTIDLESRRVDLGPLFDHVEEMAPILRPLLSQPVLGEISARFEEQFAEAFGRLVDDSTPELPHFLAGAMVASIRRFATDLSPPPAATVATELEGHIERLLSTP